MAKIDWRASVLLQRFIVAICFSACLLTGGVAQAAGGPLVAAAASLRFALEEIVDRYAGVTGSSVRLVFGSSGALVQQIENGAPFALFLSADSGYVERLVAGGYTEGTGTAYGQGVLVLFTRPGLLSPPGEGLASLARATSAGQVKRLVIANPEYAPYGRAARAALRHAGLWTQIQPLLVVGANAGQAAHFALEGAVDAALLPLTLAKIPALTNAGKYVVLPAASHPGISLHQQMVVLRGAGADAHDFFVYLQSAEVQAIFSRHGVRAISG